MEVLQGIEVYRDNYEVVTKIGEGGFGKVFCVKKRGTDQLYAAKCIRARLNRDKVKSKQEIELLKSVRNDFIISYVDSFEGPSEIILVTEYLEGGELFERIVDESFELLESDCCFFIRQVCKGLDYLHRNNIVHLDIKPENIVLRGREGRNIKIIDFGTAIKLQPGQKVQNMVGTPEFMAPEVVNFDDISLETDQWSVGVLSFILLSGYSPFLDDNDDQKMNKTLSNVTMAKYDFDYEEFEEVTADAKDFITRLLRKSPSRRMTAAACLEHSWLKEKLMRRKTARIKVTNLRKFLARRKVQNIGRALKVINVFKGAARESRSSSEGILDSRDSTVDITNDKEYVDLETILNEETGIEDEKEESIDNINETSDEDVFTKHDISDIEKDLPVRRVNFDSAENTIENFNQAPDDSSDEDDFIAAYNESEDKFDEVIRDTKKEPPKGFNLRRTKSRAAPGTVKKLLARFENNN